MSDKSNKDEQKFQSYLNNIQAQTGKSAKELVAIAKQKGLTKSRDVLTWLKQEYDLGYGHAGAIWYLIAHADDARATPTARIGKLFADKKAKWRKPYDALAAKVAKFGKDVEFSPNMTYVNVLRGGKKFAIVQPSSSERLDIGIKLKGVAPTKRFEAAGSWNPMVTHRVRVTDAEQLNQELYAWLKRAYDAAK